MSVKKKVRFFIAVALVFTLSGCSATRGPGGRSTSVGVTLTHPSYYAGYYSTRKARHLGERYSDHLEQLVEQIVDSSVGRLQFANNIVSVSMGFFTHSAIHSPDERYLEVLLGMPDILEKRTELHTKVTQLFAQYGQELLTILLSDTEIYNDSTVAGYGLNFSWRDLVRAPSGPHLSLEGAVVYVTKDQAHKLLSQKITQDELLDSAVIFARHGEEPPSLVRRPTPIPGSEAQASLPQKIEEHVIESEDLAPTQPEPQEPRQISPLSQEQAQHAKQPPVRLVPQGTGEVRINTQEQPAPRIPAVPPAAVPSPEPPPQPHTPETAPVQQDQEALSLQEQPPATPSGESLTPRLLRGFLIQLWFSEQTEAERWSELLGREGYATRLSTVGDGPLIRLRIGNFSSFAQADTRLEQFRTQGLHGLVLQVANEK